jgi:hypothetical protein
MGDRSPKSIRKNQEQKRVKSGAEAEKKRQAVVAKQVPKQVPKKK